MIDNLPAAPDPASDTPQQFNAKAAAFVLAQKAMVAQINATTANLNSIAAGGAYAIPLVGWGDPNTVKDGVGRFSIPGAQNSVSILYFNSLDSRNGNLAYVLTELFSTGWSTPRRGYITFVVLGDPSRRVSYRVNDYAEDAAYSRLTLSVTFVSQQGAAIAAGESVLMMCSRNGDKGAAGDLIAPMIQVQEQAASGTNAGTYTNNQNRALNTVLVNSLSGASLGSYIVTIPAGTYDFEGWATVYTGSVNFRSFLRNVTSGGSFPAIGSSETNNGSGASLKSFFKGRFTLSASTQFALGLALSANASGGQALNNGMVEVYSELIFKKIG
ncbi:hypothetical protein HH212_26135 [Massilia forsythiae]|uniref:Uncharacterized protein n=1 Tax=Massilia forsythiae TaxID=2728020 RepID=A0A7Z2W0S2_9BURK|nr:hypothetical protein [Massilia forsythiae]QJE03038.1 hypothetical protein HH212_26135 [Massilia forsythiae]